MSSNLAPIFRNICV